MKLSQLFSDLSLPETLQDVLITGLSSDSRYAEKGDLFFALQGDTSHGLDYVETLRDKGVVAIFYEGDPDPRTIPTDIPVFKIQNALKTMRTSAGCFYAASLAKANILGITGTEGKTSVAMFTAQALHKLGRAVGMIGTNGIGPLEQLKENTHTTPDFLALYRSIDQIVQFYPNAPKVHIVLEVTSHALDQARVFGLSFEVSSFLNLARDHLDYHKTLDAYCEAKKRLFSDYHSNASVLNISDPVGQELFEELMLKDDRKLFPVGEVANSHENYIKISDIRLHAQGLSFVLTYQAISYSVESPLFGHFNAYNLAVMVGNLLAINISMEHIIEILPAITLVKGRMEALALPNGAVAVVDYAHKPNALLQVLKALKKHIPDGNLYCIFGCGGDRDRGKRPLMAEIAEEHSDFIIVTNDNPRTEDAESIADEIFTGFKYPEHRIERILDRETAILQTLRKATLGDIVLIAGKGHEDYQIIGQTKHHFSDAEVVSAFIQKG